MTEEGRLSSTASLLPGLMPDLRGRGVSPWEAGGLALLLAVVSVAVASTHPDGIWKLAGETGIASHAKALLGAPLADYQLGLLQSVWLRKAGAGLAGLALIYGACMLCGKLLARQRGA